MSAEPATAASCGSPATSSSPGLAGGTSRSPSATTISSSSLFAELPFSEENHLTAPDLISNTTESLERFASQDVILLIARQYLIDADVMLLGRCSTATLGSMRRYEIRREVKLIEELLPHRWESAELIRSLTEEQKKLLQTGGSKQGKSKKKKKKWQDADVIAASSNLQPHDSRYQIGRCARIAYVGNPVSKHEFMVGLLHLLPTSVKILRISSSQTCSTIVPTLPSGIIQLMIESRDYQYSLESLIFPVSLTALRIAEHYYSEQQEERHLHSFACPQNLRLLDIVALPFDDGKLILSPTLTELSIYSNSPVERLVLHEGLTSLSFDLDTNQPLEKLHLPSTLYHLDLGDNFSHSLKNWQPPPSIQIFRLSKYYRRDGHEIKLPPGLKRFVFPPEYNRPLAGIQFGSNLTYLEFGRKFDSSLQGVHFPASLTEMKLGWSFSQSLTKDDWIPPPSLTRLIFRNLFTPFSQLSLPPTLRHLEMGYSKRSDDSGNAYINWPESDIARFDELASAWPPQLETLSLSSEYFRVLPQHHPQNLPSSLQVVRIDGRVVQHAGAAFETWKTVQLPAGCQLIKWERDPADLHAEEVETVKINYRW